MANGRRHEFSYTHHLALDIALENRKLDLLFDPSEDELFEKALEHASKNGKGDIGKPDIMFRQGDVMVMIEVKHGLEKQVQWDGSTHPCSCSFSIGSDPLASGTAAVKNCAENGALHYLRHALKHKDLLASNNIRTVLSVGASFEDSGEFVAVPYYGDTGKEECVKFSQFDNARYFGEKAFRGHLAAARARLDGTEEYSQQLQLVRRLFAEHPEWKKIDITRFMTLLCATAVPGFRSDRLRRDRQFDGILEYCMGLSHTLAPEQTYARNLLKSFKSGNENEALIPPMDYAAVADSIVKQANIPPALYFPIVVDLYDIHPEVNRAKIMGYCFNDYKPERIVDVGSPFALPGIMSALATKTAGTLAFVGDDPFDQLAALSMMNLRGLKGQNIFSGMDMVGRKLTKCVVCDLTGVPDPLARVSSMMKKVSAGKRGVFAVDRSAIASTAPHETELRRYLNSAFTLKKLIGCKDCVIIAIQKEPNHGSRQTKYISGQYQLATHVKSIEKGNGIKFQSGKLNNGVWIK